MGTRAAAFTAKIKSVQDAQVRLMQSPAAYLAATSGGGSGGGGGGPGGSGGGAYPMGPGGVGGPPVGVVGVGGTNPPSGVELANTLKWFANTLLNVLKDVPGQPFLMMRHKENDPERMALYPSLDYKGLYSTLLNFIDLVKNSYSFLWKNDAQTFVSFRGVIKS